MDDVIRFKLEDFELYKLARAFRRSVYALIKQLPPEEKYCLVPQMRRAALSVSNNIAEGHGRWHYQDNVRYCFISRGSIEETIDDLNVCIDEGYGDQEQVSTLKQEAYHLIGKVNSYIAYLRKMKQGGDS